MKRPIPILAAVILLLLARPSPAGDEPVRSRTFAWSYEATVREIPDGVQALDLWLPWPQTDPHQTIHRITLDAPGAVTIGREPEHGSQFLQLHADRPRGPVRVALTIVATRSEHAGIPGPLTPAERDRHLAPEPLVPLDGPVRALALEATRGLASDAEKARAIYETVTGRMRYDKTGTGWGRGDAVFACTEMRGNCSDFHALIIGMARSVGIPARFAVGLPLPRARGQGEIPGYHCWAELYVAGTGWIPVDGSEAAKDPARRAYYFGHHDEDRLEFSRGRHLRLVPPQQGPPLNFFVYPYAEVDGRPHPVIDRRFTFRDLAAPPAD